MPAIVSFQNGNEIYLLMTKDQTDQTTNVRAFDNRQEALNYFENGYRRNHARGYEASMSACLNFISFQPKVHAFDEPDITSLIAKGVIDLETFKAYSIRDVSGHMLGALCTGQTAKEWHDSGTTPNLIRQ
jgi:hypothetical protein